MNKESSRHFSFSTKWIVYISLLPGIALVVFLVWASYATVSVYRKPHNIQTTQVIAAAEDLEAGTVLTKSNIGKTRLTHLCLLVDSDWVSSRDAEVLFGHKLLAPVKRLEPIKWHNTDIVITNWQSTLPTTEHDGSSTNVGQQTDGVPK